MRPSDVFALVLQGVLVASVPLALVWALRGQERLRRLAWVSAFVTFDLVVFGAFTRLTDSGLGCPDWPGCFARANPALAQGDIAMAQALLPGGPVDMQKAWIEMIHRTLAGAVGVLIVVLVVMTWRSRSRHRQAFALALLALVLVIVQAGFGAYTVTLKLEPVIVTAHLLLGLSLLSCLSWLAVSIDSAWVVDGKRHAGRASSVAPLAALGLVVLAIQIALGGWVSTNYAVLACDGYPRCEGRLVPPMDFADGFALFRALGHTSNGDFLPQAALAAIHWTHRNSALVLTLVLVALALALWRRTGLHREARNLVLLLALQWATGLANVLLGWPLIAAVVHSAGAAAMLVLLVLINYRLRSDPDRAPPQFMGAPATLSQ